MALKSYLVDGVGPVRIQKRKGTRSMRIRLSQDGVVTVGIPYWLPFNAGLDFVNSHKEWIEKHRKPIKILANASRIGMYHSLIFKDGVSLRFSIKGDKVCVSVPTHLKISDEKVQQTAIRGAKKALIEESPYLGEKLSEIAEEYGFKYSSVAYKFMRSKWGSCSSNQMITLNYRLLDLPEILQRYVMVHELAHTLQMNHSAKFWQIVSDKMPDFKRHRADLKNVHLDW